MAIDLKAGFAVAGVLASLLLTGCAPRAAAPAASEAPDPHSAPAGHESRSTATDDWRNATYRVTCDGLLMGTIPTGLQNGAATVPVDISESPYYDDVDVRLQAIASGDVDGDGNSETVVLLECSPQPSNASVQEVHVFHVDGSQLAVLPSARSLPQTTILAPLYVPSGLAVQNGDVVAAMKAYGPDDSHATGPSVPFTVRWHWTGKVFAPLP